MYINKYKQEMVFKTLDYKFSKNNKLSILKEIWKKVYKYWKMY